MPRHSWAPLSFDAVDWVTKALSLCTVFYEPCDGMFVDQICYSISTMSFNDFFQLERVI